MTENQTVFISMSLSSKLKGFSESAIKIEDSLQRDLNVKHRRDNLNLVISPLKATYHLIRAIKSVVACVAFQSRDK